MFIQEFKEHYSVNKCWKYVTIKGKFITDKRLYCALHKYSSINIQRCVLFCDTKGNYSKNKHLLVCISIHSIYLLGQYVVSHLWLHLQYSAVCLFLSFEHPASDRDQLTAIVKSCHKFSIGLRSGLWLSHCNKSKVFLLNHFSGQLWQYD